MAGKCKHRISPAVKPTLAKFCKVPIADGGGKRERTLPPTIRITEAAVQFSILAFQLVGQVIRRVLG
jgi:hypothetical protein